MQAEMNLKCIIIIDSKNLIISFIEDKNAKTSNSYNVRQLLSIRASRINFKSSKNKCTNLSKKET
jgi:hypothetical protein